MKKTTTFHLIQTVTLLSILLVIPLIWFWACEETDSKSHAGEGEITIIPSDSFLYADGDSNMTLLILLEAWDGNPLQNPQLSLSTSIGSLQVADVTTGRAVAILTSSADEGTARVNVCVTNPRHEMETYIDIPFIKGNFAVEVSDSKSGDMVKGSSATIYADVTELITGQPVPEGVEVNFFICDFNGLGTMTIGSLSNLRAMTDANGRAEVIYTAPNRSGMVTLAVYSGSKVPFATLDRPCPAEDSANYPGYRTHQIVVREGLVTNTPTNTPTSAFQSPQPTATDTDVPTATVVPTNTPVPTLTPTTIPTNTPTLIPTDTPLPTNTVVPTHTAVPPTPTPLPSETPIPPTATAIPTPVPTDSPTPRPTLTPNPTGTP